MSWHLNLLIKASFLSFFWNALTGYYWLSGLNNRNLFLTVLEARKSEIKALADLVSGKAHFLVHRSCLSLCPQHGRVGLWDLFYKALIPFMRVQPYDLIISQGPHRHSNTLGLGFNMWIWGREGKHWSSKEYVPKILEFDFLPDRLVLLFDKNNCRGNLFITLRYRISSCIL